MVVTTLASFARDLIRAPQSQNRIWSSKTEKEETTTTGQGPIFADQGQARMNRANTHTERERQRERARDYTVQVCLLLRALKLKTK